MANATIARDDDACRQNDMHGPIFIVGSSRSGTTMMGRILGRHQRVFTFNELHFLEEVWTPGRGHDRLSREEAVALLCRLFSTQRDGYFRAGNPAAFVTEAMRLLEGDCAEDTLLYPDVFWRFLAYETLRHGRGIACEQTPRNVFYLREILDLFPGARIVNMVRDPRDVLLSQKWRWRRRVLGAHKVPLRASLVSWANYHPVVTSRIWAASVRAAQALRGHPRIMTVRFEDLVTTGAGVVRDICKFLGLEFNEEMLRIPQIGSSRDQDETNRTGMDPRKAGSWRRGGLSPTEIYICEHIAGQEMRQIGYQREYTKPSVSGFVWVFLLLPFKLLAALALNFRRASNLASYVKNRLSL